MLKKFLKFLIIKILIGNHAIVLSIPIDNGVEGEPVVTCHPDGTQVDFRTRNAFEGHVYVKGRYAEVGCRADAAAGGGAKQISIVVPFSKCGVQRIRSLNPRGISVKTTIIITFHPQFLTKVDRGYAVQCFYLESEKTVSAQLEVSELTTAPLTQQAPAPICRYDVLENGPEGQPVRFGIVGQQVYHKWTCTTEAVDTYCILVHNCVVQNGAGSQAQLIDDNGCSIDRYLLQNLEYTTDLTAGQEAHVFKFADQPALNFQCQITVNVKEPGSQCPRPQCAQAVVGTTNVIYGQTSPYPPTNTGYPGTSSPSAAPAAFVSGAPLYPPTTFPSFFLSGPPPYPPTTQPSLAVTGSSSTYPAAAFARRAAAAASAFFINSQSLILAETTPATRSNETNVNLTAFVNTSLISSASATRRRSKRSDDSVGQGRVQSQVMELGVWDVNAQPITALDIDDTIAHYQVDLIRNSAAPTSSTLQPVETNSEANSGSEICLNTTTFGCVFSIAIAAALAAGIATIALCKRKSLK